jgi:hypothetical protein
MFKLLATAATALLASASGVSAYMQATVADTCTVVNYTERATDFSTLNTIVDLLSSGTLLETYLADYDPLILTNQTIDVIDFSLLGIDFTLTPTLDSLNLTGLTLVRPYYINVTGDQDLAVGAYFDGEVSLDATFSIEIAQLNHQWYQICWTNILKPSTCPPATITADVTLALDVPVVKAGLEAYMYNCKSGIATSTCSNVTVSSILVAAITGSYSSILTSIEERLINASVSSFDASFTSITNIDFTFQKTSVLINQLINSLLDFSADELNKKGDIYNSFIKVLDTIFKSILNNLIDSDLEPLFGATCL